MSSYEIYLKYHWYRGTEEDWINDLASGVLANMPDQEPVNLASDGLTFTYGKVDNLKTYTISDKSIYLDGSLSDEKVSKYSNVYNNFNEALAAAKDGTAENPTTIYIAPWVYWIHDPNSKSTNDPFGIYADVDYLQMIGLTENPENVVIAGNYGHDEGYDGANWTMFNFTGDGLTLENITFGGYCNIDLDYKLNPRLNVPKRTSNITQCQIASLNGDKFYAKNCNFISRLNMMPFNNSERALYENCHFESTDDSLNGSSQAVYLNCDFDFYASKPWYSSSGSTLLNCDFNIVPINVIPGEVVEQYLSKAVSPYTLIDCRYHSNLENEVVIGFNDILPTTYRSNYSNVTYNGQSIKMDNGGKNPGVGVDISNTEVLKAYKVIDKDGNTIYNIYNLLRGNDNWDPLGQQAIIEELGATNLPTKLNAFVDADYRPTSVTIETGKTTASLGFEIVGPQDTNYTSLAEATWSIADADKDYLKLIPAAEGLSCVVEGTNNTEETQTVIVTVKTSSDFEGAIEVKVQPAILPAPSFISEPVIVQDANGVARVDYELDLGGRADMSEIIWTVCDDENGTNPITIAVGRDSTPLQTITLSKAYVGKYLMATIRPKHIRSEYGEAKVVISSLAVAAEGIVDSKVVSVNTHTFAVDKQANIIPGFWTVDQYKPLDTYEGEDFASSNKISDTSGWNYGTGNKNGFLDYTGLYETNYGARLMYTPLDGSYNDMEVEVKLAPGKTAAQGFGSAKQYLDILLKVDTTTLTGYGLRIYRNTGDSCCVALVELTNGKSKLLTEAQVTSAYLTECTVKVWTEGTKLNASISTTAPNPGTGYLHEVNLSCDVSSNANGGFYLQHAGTVGDNATYIGGITINYK